MFWLIVLVEIVSPVTLLCWTPVMCALRPVYTVENRTRNQQETRGHLKCGIDRSPDQSGRRSILFPETKLHFCSNNPSTIHSILSQTSISLYTENLTIFYFKVWSRLWLPAASQSQQNSVLSSCIFFLHVFLYMHTYVMYLSFKFTPSSVSCNWLIALRPKVEWHTVQKTSRAGELATKLLHGDICPWSSKRHRKQVACRRPSSLELALSISRPFHTHAHAHTLKTASRRSLSPSLAT